MPNLVIQTAFLGDLLLCIPLLRAIRARFPQQPLFLVCRKGYGDLFKKLGLCDEVFEVARGSGKEKREVFKKLSTHQFDFIFCPHQSIRSAFLMNKLSGQTKVGFAQWWNRLSFHKRVPRRPDLPDALRQISLLQIFSDFHLPEGFLNSEARDSTDEFMAHNIPLAFQMTLPRFAGLRDPQSKTILIAPGSVWPTKRWTPEGFAQTAQELVKKGFEIIFVGSPEERDLCAAIARDVPNSQNQAGSHNFEQLLELMAKSQALITNDSGAMHMAAVAGLPTLAIFGPTVLSFGYRPWQTRAVVVQRDLPCRPCGKHGGKVCPLGHHNCMKNISAQDVLGNLLALFNLHDLRH